jgi:hypothetical protein
MPPDPAGAIHPAQRTAGLEVVTDGRLGVGGGDGDVAVAQLKDDPRACLGQRRENPTRELARRREVSLSQQALDVRKLFVGCGVFENLERTSAPPTPRTPRRLAMGGSGCPFINKAVSSEIRRWAGRC